MDCEKDHSEHTRCLQEHSKSVKDFQISETKVSTDIFMNFLQSSREGLEAHTNDLYSFVWTVIQVVEGELWLGVLLFWWWLDLKSIL